MASRAERPYTPRSRHHGRSRHDYVVYFAERDGLIKIGVTSNLPARLRQLGATELGYVYGDHKMERLVHCRFRHERVSGEWFQPSERLLQFVREHDGTTGWQPDLG